MGTTGRSAVAVIAVVSWAGCAVELQGPPPRRPPPPPVVVVVAPPPPPPATHVPPGQIRAAEVHERNAARKAAHDAEKARRHDRVAHDDDDEDDDNDDDPGHQHGHGHGHGDR